MKSGGFSNCTGIISASIPTATPSGLGYRIRVVNNNPIVTGSPNLSDIEVYHYPCDQQLLVEVGRKSIAITEKDIKLYPNPAKENVTIELPSSNLNFHLIIFDINGKKIREDNLDQTISTINTSDFNGGIYLVKLTNDDINITKKLLIIK